LLSHHWLRELVIGWQVGSGYLHPVLLVGLLVVLPIHLCQTPGVLLLGVLLLLGMASILVAVVPLYWLF